MMFLSRSKIILGLGVIIGGSLVVMGYIQAAGCNLYAAGSAVQSDFGVPYDIFKSGSPLLLNATCGSTVTVTVGDGDTSTTAVWGTGYKYVPADTANPWHPLTFSSGWGFGSASTQIKPADINSGTNYFVGYTCHWTGSTWKCGCSDSACTQPKWQLQAFNTSGGAGTNTLDFKMDPDGPGPLSGAEGTVSSRLLMVRPPASTLLVSTFFPTGVPIANTADGSQPSSSAIFPPALNADSSFVADLSWTSSASNCDLSESFDKTPLFEPMTFTFKALPSTGHARALIPVVAPGAELNGITAVSMNPRFTINCGGTSKTIIATFASISPGGVPGELTLLQIALKRVEFYNAFIASGGKTITMADMAVGPAKVDALGMIAYSFIPNSDPSHCQTQTSVCGSYGNYVFGEGRMVTSVGTVVGSTYVWASINASTCTTRGANQVSGPLSGPLGLAGTSDTGTVTCGDATDTVY